MVTIRGVFKGPRGPLEPEILLAGLAHTALPPELPEWARLFHQGGERLSKLLRGEERSRGLHASNE